jgi:CheY-like chemotaxis protein
MRAAGSFRGLPMNSPLRMVVVDDDSNVRLLLEHAFRAPEFQTDAFPTAAAALQRVAAIRPHCVVSDMLMPDMDGETLLRAVRALPGLERVPFIVLSAVRSEARIRSVLDAGANAFLLKPFPVRDLLEKVRVLLEQQAAGQPLPGRAGEPSLPTRPVTAAPHTMTSTAIRRPPPAPLGRMSPAAYAASPASPTALPAEPPAWRAAPAAQQTAPAPPPAAATTLAGVAQARVAAPSSVPTRPSLPAAERRDIRRVDISPPQAGLGFGRFTRVELRGRSLVVLSESVRQPKFTVTTVIAEKGVPLRKVQSELTHPLAREDDRETVRRQLDQQHEDVLRRLDELVVDATPRRVIWSDQSRSVDPRILAWAMSAVAQLAESEAGVDETARQLRLTRETALVDEDTLRAFHVTPLARVVLEPQHAGRLPQRAVRAVAGWCRAFAIAALQADIEALAGPIRHATRRHSLELERMGFYGRLLRQARP